MKAIILAAGEGTRMRPLTENTPKALLKIHGRPAIEYIFDALPDEITEVVVVVRYLQEMIRSYLGSTHRGRAIRFVEGSPRGSAYSLFVVAQCVDSDERFLVINGDEFPSRDDIVACLKEPLSIISFEYDQPEKAATPSIDRDGFITGIVEKQKNPPTNVVVGGIMVLNGKIFLYKPTPNEKGEFFYTSILNQLVKRHKVKAVRSHRYYGDLTFPHDIARIERLVSPPTGKTKKID